MIHTIGSVPAGMIDRWRTGNYGEDFFSEALEVCRCGICDEGIVEGEKYYDFDGEIVCEDCIAEYLDSNYAKEAELNDDYEY